jgi:hypothetical protein
MFAPKAELLHLAAASGGVRCDKLAREYSRFRNTGYYVAKHRGVSRFAAIRSDVFGNRRKAGVGVAGYGRAAEAMARDG